VASIEAGRKQHAAAPSRMGFDSPGQHVSQSLIHWREQEIASRDTAQHAHRPLGQLQTMPLCMNSAEASLMTLGRRHDPSYRTAHGLSRLGVS